MILTIKLLTRKDGSLANADVAPTITSVTRVSTGVVVVSNVAMESDTARSAVGAYKYDVLDCVGGEAYLSVGTVTLNGRVINWTKTLIASESATTVFIAVGRYVTSDDVYDLCGRENVRLMSNLDGADQLEDSARVWRAIKYAESMLHARLRSIYDVPLTLGDDDKILVVDACARLALWWLSQNRGIADENKNVAGKMENHRGIALAQINRWVSGIDLLESPAVLDRATMPPTGVDTTGDE